MVNAALQHFPVFFILAAGFLWLRRPDDRWLHVLAISGVWIPLVEYLTLGLAEVSHFTPARYDEWFLLADRALGSPAFWVGRAVQSIPWLRVVATCDYALYVFAAFSAVAANFTLIGIRRGYAAFLAMLFSNVLAVPFYSIWPASGPRYAFASWPWSVPEISHLIVLHLAAPPNCLPSNHLSLALLVAAFIWRWRAGRILGIVHVCLTVVATLGLGEHYAIDLFAAAPYAFGIFWLAEKVTGPIRSAPGPVLAPSRAIADPS
jgi:PAP2 superfamily protein